MGKKKKNNIEYPELPELNLQIIEDYLGTFENINQLPMIKEVLNYFNTNYWDEAFYENRLEGFNFILRDGTNCNLTYSEYNCILHSFSEQKYEEAGEYIYNVDDDIYICATCLTKLQTRPDILKQYEVFNNEYCNDYQKILLPINWTDEKINKWCKKSQEKQDEYCKKRRLRDLTREQEEYNDCCVYTHWKNEECECNITLEEDQEPEECEYFDY